MTTLGTGVKKYKACNVNVSKVLKSNLTDNFRTLSQKVF